jgi:organic radical activating enzyme
MGMIRKSLGRYINGNCFVEIFSDGTKIRLTHDDKFDPEFPECMDVKITNYCDRNCPYCHENSSLIGKHGDIMNVKFIETLKPYTEIAIGGGNPLSHPRLVPFLQKLKDLRVISNITVNQTHFDQNKENIKKLMEDGLITGLGISLEKASSLDIALIRKLKNVVIHVINGVTSVEDLGFLANRRINLLILGYKMIGRGTSFQASKNDLVEKNQKNMRLIMPCLLNAFKVVSFDNLALEQLNIREIIKEEDWDEFYMGDDGSHTMFIDLVENNFAVSSTSMERIPISDDIIGMFQKVKQMKKDCKNEVD